MFHNTSFACISFSLFLLKFISVRLFYCQIAWTNSLAGKIIEIVFHRKFVWLEVSTCSYPLSTGVLLNMDVYYPLFLFPKGFVLSSVPRPFDLGYSGLLYVLESPIFCKLCIVLYIVFIFAIYHRNVIRYMQVC